LTFVGTGDVSPMALAASGLAKSMLTRVRAAPLSKSIT
jgi:hypothetical protein